jgi:hypothetical protein
MTLSVVAGVAFFAGACAFPLWKWLGRYLQRPIDLYNFQASAALEFSIVSAQRKTAHSAWLVLRCTNKSPLRWRITTGAIHCMRVGENPACSATAISLPVARLAAHSSCAITFEFPYVPTATSSRWEPVYVGLDSGAPPLGGRGGVFNVVADDNQDDAVELPFMIGVIATEKQMFLPEDSTHA